MAVQYEFVDRWFVPGASAEEVYDVIGDQLNYPRWWSDAFLEVDGDEGPPRPGRRATMVSKGFLPYKLRWTAVITAAEPPRSIRFEMSGDFQGNSEWTIEESGGGTAATLDWRPAVDKPIVKALTPILRPLFRKNHVWAMDRGQENISAEVIRRRAAATT